MTDPNTRAMKGDLGLQKQFEATLDTGWLPIISAARHPSIIQRWRIEHRIAPGPSSELVAAKWDQRIWVEAWIASLFAISNAMDLLTNAWATMGENKMRVVLLKAQYDNALNDKHVQLTLLIERQLVLSATSSDMHRALNVAIANTRRTINEDSTVD